MLALLNNAIEKLTANAAVFPTPPITVLAMTTLSENFTKAINAATEGGTNARKVRDNYVLEVRDVLRRQADHVRSVCNGDAALLTLTGFELSKVPEPIKEVGIPQNLKAEATDESGKLALRWSRTVGGRLFELQKASGDPALGEVSWATVARTGRQRVVIGGLDPFKECFFRVIAIGITHEGMPSDIVMGRAA